MTADPPPQCDAALALAFDVLGKRWTGVVLGVLSQGEAGFAEISRAVGGISDSMLSARLAELIDGGLVERGIRDSRPVTVRYRLTPTGEALVPALRELGAWARGHLMSD